MYLTPLKADFDDFQQYLLDSDLADCYLSDSIECVWSVIKNLVYMCLHIPTVKQETILS